MSEAGTKTYSLAQVAEHNSNKSSWIVIHNNVYDVTAFLNEVSNELMIFNELYLIAHVQLWWQCY